MKEPEASALRIPIGGVRLNGDLTIPADALGLVLFAHGSGSSRLSPRNRYVAGVLQQAGIGTLLFDLLTPEEEREDEFTGHLRFNIALLAERLVLVTRWIIQQNAPRDFQLGYFGASTGAAAALMAAGELGDKIDVVVSRGGRPDLATEALARVRAATLLIVGAHDDVVVRLNQQAHDRLQSEKEIKVIPGATHLFQEHGALEQVAQLAADWFREHFHAIEVKKV
jgi:pimeloyl-ACP methyl ester carboxylesterase